MLDSQYSGACSSDDCSVHMDLNLAKLLHQKWKDTIQVSLKTIAAIAASSCQPYLFVACDMCLFRFIVRLTIGVCLTGKSQTSGTVLPLASGKWVDTWNACMVSRRDTCPHSTPHYFLLWTSACIRAFCWNVLEPFLMYFFTLAIWMCMQVQLIGATASQRHLEPGL